MATWCVALELAVPTEVDHDPNGEIPLEMYEAMRISVSPGAPPFDPSSTRCETAPPVAPTRSTAVPQPFDGDF